MSPKNILVVDDEPDLTLSLQLGLERRGFNVITFNDPRLALENTRSHDYDLIITDIRMPKMTGFELYREIRKHDRLTPICFFSAFEIFQKEFETMFPNVDGTVFLKKPINLSELELRINELTSKDRVVNEDVLLVSKIRSSGDGRKTKFD